MTRRRPGERGRVWIDRTVYGRWWLLIDTTNRNRLRPYFYWREDDERGRWQAEIGFHWSNGNSDPVFNLGRVVRVPAVIGRWAGGWRSTASAGDRTPPAALTAAGGVHRLPPPMR